MRHALLLAWGVIALFFHPALTAIGAEPPKAAETKESWAGSLKIREGLELQMVVNITTDKSGAKTATFDSPDQNATGIKIDSISLDKAKLSFEVKSIQGRYEGKLSKDGKEAVGTWSQGAGTIPMTLKKLDKPFEEAKIVGKEAVWEGKLALPAGATLRMVLHVGKSADGKYLATLDSPDQGAKGIKASSVTLDAKSIKIEVKSLSGVYEGKFNDKGNETKGTWSQGGSKFPLDLKLVEKASEINRPQMPHEPFPYQREQVTYKNEPGKTTLAGELTIPEGSGPFPAVILISGSGAQDRDETLMGHKPFFVLADALSRRGIAVLRVDDRGVGGSTGNTMQSTMEDSAGDVIAGLEFLKGRREIDKTKLGLIGHSEGGVIAPIVATKSMDVAFIVLMAGTGLPGDQIITLQTRLIAKSTGANDDEINKGLEVQTALLAIVRDEKDPAKLDTKLKEFLSTKVAELPADGKTSADEVKKSIESQGETIKSPWLQYFLRHDPRPVLEKVKCPVLALVGEKDLQVPPKENLAAIEASLKQGGNTASTVKELPGLNHLFQNAKTGGIGEYSEIEETIAPSALTLIGDWIAERTGGKK